MIPINPTKDNMSTFALVLRWAQSVYKALNGGWTVAQPSSQLTSGVFGSFVQDNAKGTVVSIGPAGSGATYTWPAANSPIAINHGLLQQPIGFIPIFKNKTCDIYATVTPTTNTINLACTDATATTLVWILGY